MNCRYFDPFKVMLVKAYGIAPGFIGSG